MEKLQMKCKIHDKKRTGLQELLMMLFVWGVIEFDGISTMIPNQVIALGLPVIIWFIGAVYIFRKMRKQNDEHLYYVNTRLKDRDWLIFFFVIMGGLTIALSNYFYAGLKPLFVRELFTGYPLYTIRNLLYYPLEVLLMLELLIYSQRAGELLAKKAIIPWGAFALFLLWGLPHLLWHGFFDGLIASLRDFIYCIPFYVSNKNIKTSYFSMLILWFL